VAVPSIFPMAPYIPGREHSSSSALPFDIRSLMER
jgi:hypothetical protein